MKGREIMLSLLMTVGMLFAYDAAYNGETPYTRKATRYAPKKRR